ncbi:hypothetical protein ACQPX6_18060 [Actinomycetospora sp. CA-101289]|uniref:hypothetical protein n=1 Tax=Actinomycetospora sp. CA-101289 TaxID=3239893 RepID=UPI003D98B210
MVVTAEAPRTHPAATTARAGIWLLPVHSVLLAVGTLTHQPDPRTAFDAYARYVTTGPFLAGHLVASIAGAALGALGAVAALAFLRGRAARPAVLAVALLVAGQVVNTAVFGAAAFAQPAIGRAHLRGVSDAAAIDADVYGLPLVLTALVGVLLLLAGSIALAVAVVRAGAGDRALRRAGVVYAVGFALFLVFGLVLTVLQPLAALVAAGAAVVVARRLPRV